MDGDIPLAPSYGVYISQLVRYARICNNVSDFNERNAVITEKLLHQGYRFHKLLKTFTKFYHRYKDLVCKYNKTCKNLINSGISHPAFYGDVVHKANTFKNNTQRLTKITKNLIRKGYRPNIICKSLTYFCFSKSIENVISAIST